MRHIVLLAGAGLLLAACDQAQEPPAAEDDPVLDAPPELANPPVDDPVDDPGMMPPEMMDEDTGGAMDGDPPISDEPAPAEEPDAGGSAAPDEGYR
ncbi:hypothetical protein HFP57_17825 [Parasphingopyxis algicola]|uniref:hypothetical protein n=1 Tax=Parasphingopyxis algicola TaxID=2026624 RepID=UPI0015A19D5C|nr:hypothetical protein [Parasphingopyxis algicola]QLC26712.1 hypothetical protein HFP57_17825 [Parasphingopyxis algicola]